MHTILLVLVTKDIQMHKAPAKARFGGHVDDLPLQAKRLFMCFKEITICNPFYPLQPHFKFFLYF